MIATISTLRRSQGIHDSDRIRLVLESHDAYEATFLRAIDRAVCHDQEPEHEAELRRWSTPLWEDEIAALRARVEALETSGKALAEATETMRRCYVELRGAGWQDPQNLPVTMRVDAALAAFRAVLEEPTP